MIFSVAVRSGVDAVRDVVRVISSAGAHAAWWIDHNLGGSPRVRGHSEGGAEGR